MKNSYKFLLPALLALTLGTSCNKYLDVKPKGRTILKNVQDYDQWLDAVQVYTSGDRELNLLADDQDNVGIALTSTLATDLVYLWAPQFTLDIKATPLFWANHYSNIYYYNAVIDEINDAVGGTPQDKKRLMAEGLLGRSMEYLYLVNLFGKSYDSTTADKDLAVPFVTSVDVTDATPPRSTVKEIYDHIISDLNQAIPDLPADNPLNRFRGSIAAGYSLLARTYFLAHDYTDAAKNAQLALNADPATLPDYNTMASDVGIGPLQTRPDAIYARYSSSNSYIEYPTLDLLKSFDTTDLRLHFFYRNIGNYSFTQRGLVQYVPYGLTSGKAHPNNGTTIAEMHLIIAEAAVRSGDLATALQHLDAVRKCRIRAATYQPFQSSDPAAVLQKVLDERKFEFAFNGLRWLDMVRLNAEGSMPTVNRYGGTGDVIATLEPGSPRYQLQVPSMILYFNPGMPQNP